MLSCAIGSCSDFFCVLVCAIDCAGVVSTVAGSELGTWADGVGTEAGIGNPSSLSLGYDGDVYVADTNNNRIRKISSSGEFYIRGWLRKKFEVGFSPSTSAVLSRSKWVVIMIYL